VYTLDEAVCLSAVAGDCLVTVATVLYGRKSEISAHR
jgi:hypothetical protein